MRRFDAILVSKQGIMSMYYVVEDLLYSTVFSYLVIFGYPVFVIVHVHFVDRLLRSGLSRPTVAQRLFLCRIPFWPIPADMPCEHGVGVLRLRRAFSVVTLIVLMWFGLPSIILSQRF